MKIIASTSRHAIILICHFYHLIGYVFTQEAHITIGGLVTTPFEARVFRYSVDFVNENLPISPEFKLRAVIKSSDLLDSFHAFQAACHLAEQGVVAMIGPMSSTTVSQVAPVSEALSLPHLAPLATSPLLGHKLNYPFLTRLMPPDTELCEALVQLVSHFGWTKIAILKSETEYGVQGLFKFQELAANRKWKIVSFQQFKLHTDPVKTDASQQLTVIKQTGVRVVILHCEAVFGRHVLHLAHTMGMMGEGWAWLLTSGLSSSNELINKPVPPYLIGVVGIRPHTAKGTLYDTFSRGWIASGSTEELDTVGQVLADAVLTVVHAVRHLHEVNQTSVTSGQTLSCERSPPTAWPKGEEMLSAIRRATGSGVRSNIKFNKQASPENIAYEYVNMKSNGWAKVGEWTESDGFSMFRENEILFLVGRRTVHDFASSLVNKTLTVVTIHNPPFIVLPDHGRDDVKPLEAEGLCVDLLNKLSEDIGFHYELYRVKDDNYGIKDPVTHKWNGIIRDIVDRNADLGLADLTVTSMREQDADFTTPYVDSGLTFVMKAPDQDPAHPFIFLYPFSKQLWIYIILTSIAVALSISLVNKLSPYDYHGEFIYQDHDTQYQEANTYKEWKNFLRRKRRRLAVLNFTNATWLTLGGLFRQGAEKHPKSPSGRMISVFWWIFVVIISATYTASLTAYFTTSRIETPINSVGDLIEQTIVEYGTLKSSSFEEYYRQSSNSVNRDMYAFMRARNGLVGSAKEGVDRARTGGYAFIFDISTLDYMVASEPCNTIRTVGKGFGDIGYGFALQKDSPYKNELSNHILRMRGNGYMDQLKQKWFVENNECAPADDSNQYTEGQLNSSNFQGMFYIVYGGLLVGFLVLPLEWLSACLRSVHSDDPTRPRSLYDAFRRRWWSQRMDIAEDWMPYRKFLTHNCRRKDDKTTKME